MGDLQKKLVDWVESDNIKDEIAKRADRYDLEFIQYDYLWGQEDIRVDLLFDGAWYEGDLEKLGKSIEHFFGTEYPYLEDIETVIFDGIEYWEDEDDSEHDFPQLQFRFLFIE